MQIAYLTHTAPHRSRTVGNIFKPNRYFLRATLAMPDKWLIEQAKNMACKLRKIMHPVGRIF